MTTGETHILLVQGQSGDWQPVIQRIRSMPFSLATTTHLASAKELIAQKIPNLVISDWQFADGNALELLQADNDSIPLMILSSCGNEAAAVQAIKAGALDYVVKSDQSLSRLPQLISNALEQWKVFAQKKKEEMELELYKTQLEELVSKRTSALLVAQDKLTHSEKLSALGKLVSCIAHEFNNPIFGVHNILEQIRERGTMDKTCQKLSGLAIKECERMANLIRQLQDFYQPSQGLFKRADVQKILDDIITLTSIKFRNRKIQVIRNYSKNLPRIMLVEDQIKQVFLNLLNNAEESLPVEGGTVHINTSFSSTHITIQFKDSGQGISAEHIANIFEPFFTTKSIAKGTGLGLSVSYGLIKKHGGDIEVVSQQGEGSTFTLTLPLNAEQQTETKNL